MSENSMIYAVANLACAKAVKPATPADYLKALSNDLAEQVVAGKTVVSTSEAGGGVTFAFPDGMSPGGAIAVVNGALDLIASNPGITYFAPRRIRRLQVSFAKATIT